MRKSTALIPAHLDIIEANKSICARVDKTALDMREKSQKINGDVL